jgi:hypothetical protein
MATRSWYVHSAVVVGAAAAVLVTAGPAVACQEGHHGNISRAERLAPHAHVAAGAAADPGAVKNVEVLGHIPAAKGAISINFIRYRHNRQIMFVTGEFGLKAYDITRDPARPELVGQFDLPGMWQTEDTEVDHRRKLVFLSRDPRAFGGDVLTGESGIYTVDVSDPTRLRQLSYVKVPAGHTTSCVDGCRYLWTGGPAKSATMPAEWGGRPVWVTDMRDPRRPVVFPDPIDLGRNDGKTDYAHDVQMDAAGVAWVSGRGGLRGYWPTGLRYDPVQRRVRLAKPWDPVPFAGGGISELTAASKFMHNSFRAVGPTRNEAADPRVWGNGNLVYVTEEAFNDGCATDGVLVIASLQGSYRGQGWRSTPAAPFRLRTVGSWSVAGQEGSDPTKVSCSAHYFSVRKGILVQSFYEQGTRFIDVRDPSNPTQVGVFRPGDATAWAPYFHGDYVYVADRVRGVDIIRLARG